MAKGKSPRRYYFDACLFLSVVEEVSDRVPAIKAIIEDSENGGCDIFTSQLSIAEVAFAKTEKEGKALDPAAERRIDELWHATSPIQLVEVHQGIVVRAKELVRAGMEAGWARRETWSMKAHDAIHLATAWKHHVDAFLTYDDKLRKYTQVLGFEVRQPQPPQLLMFAPAEPAWKPRVPPHWRALTPKPVECNHRPLYRPVSSPR